MNSGARVCYFPPLWFWIALFIPSSIMRKHGKCFFFQIFKNCQISIVRLHCLNPFEKLAPKINFYVGRALEWQFFDGSTWPDVAFMHSDKVFENRGKFRQLHRNSTKKIHATYKISQGFSATQIILGKVWGNENLFSHKISNTTSPLQSINCYFLALPQKFEQKKKLSTPNWLDESL